MKKISLILILLCGNIITRAQIINTIAGNGSPTYSGDSGPATAAGIYWPVHTAMDGSGNIFFTDYSNARIRRISSTGIITTYGGNGTSGYSGDGLSATVASINGPTGITLDGSGNLFFSDWLNYRIRKISPTGIITTIVGNGTPGFSGDGGLATAAQISKPWGIVADGSGNIYFSDRYNNRIRKINTSGYISTIAGTGATGSGGDGGPATAAQLHEPVGLALDIGGNLYISDFSNNLIRKINTSGTISTIGGNTIAGYTGDSGPATAAELNNPVGLSVDSAGNIYIADYGNNVVRKISTAGIITTIAGNSLVGYSGDGGSPTTARINRPQGVSVYGSDIYICDVNNNRIRIINKDDAPPYFVGGSVQSLIVCQTEAITPVPINSLLAATDTDPGQTETWSLSAPPSHGTVMASYITTSTGGLLTPVGLTYTPTLGYIGPDMFEVTMSDGTTTTTTTINVTIELTPNAGNIAGIDSVCPGNTTPLTETSGGGIWSSSDPSISAINSTGIVTGVTPGSDTLIYTVINSCGIVSAIFPFWVQDYDICHTGINTLAQESNGTIKIFPNPGSGSYSVKLLSGTEEQVQFVITNVIGEKVKEFSFPANKEIEVKLDEPAGVYFLSASSSSGNYFAKMTLER